MTKTYDVCVIGLGYIGLPTAIMFAQTGLRVIGVDINPDVVSTLKLSELHIKEPGLEAPLKEAIKRNNLETSTRICPADVYIIAVPTPFDKSSRNPVLDHVEKACSEISLLLKKGDLIINESTSPVGSTERITSFLAQRRLDLTFPEINGPKADISIAYCPERVLPGNIMNELVENDRIIGGMTTQCSQKAIDLYSAFVNGEFHIASNPRVAEMTKLSENAFRDVNIAFANEISIVGDKLNVDAREVIKLANFHPRVQILEPGPGVGGHCIAVDPWFLVHNEPENTTLIKAARAVNDSKPAWVYGKIIDAAEKIKSKAGAKKEGLVKIAVYGLAFKKNTGDLRESPAISICKMINQSRKFQLVIVEPNVSFLNDDMLPSKLVTYEQAASSQIHVLLVDHDDFKAHRPPNGIKIDTRGLWN